jgi:hypothetical protein
VRSGRALRSFDLVYGQGLQLPLGD